MRKIKQMNEIENKAYTYYKKMNIKKIMIYYFYISNRDDSKKYILSLIETFRQAFLN